MASKKPPDAPIKPVLTDEEVLAQLAREKAERDRLIREARENIAKYGTAIAPVPGLTATPIPVPAAGEEAVRIAPRAKGKPIAAKWFKVFKVCPHCGIEKNVGKDFGIVVRRGLESAMGWCRSCRNTTSYKDKPRKSAAARKGDEKKSKK